MKFKIFTPWNNLGCPGFRIGRLYVDAFRLSGFPWFGVFMNTGKAKYRWSWKKGFRQTEM